MLRHLIGHARQVTYIVRMFWLTANASMVAWLWYVVSQFLKQTNISIYNLLYMIIVRFITIPHAECYHFCFLTENSRFSKHGRCIVFCPLLWTYIWVIMLPISFFDLRQILSFRTTIGALFFFPLLGSMSVQLAGAAASLDQRRVIKHDRFRGPTRCQGCVS